MTYLLDTHTFLWWMTEPGRLSDRVGRIMQTSPEEIAFSAVSGWELAIKTSIGKLQGVPLDALATEVAAQGWHELPLMVRHLPLVSSLPFLHHDPFDRALVAQASVDGLTLLSRDPAIARYPVSVLW